MNNLAKAKKIEKLLGLCGNDTDSEYHGVADAVTDLIHFCDANGISFNWEMKTAHSYYVSELEEQAVADQQQQAFDQQQQEA